MFIDFVTLLLINMVAGLVILATYLIFGLNDEDQRRWAPGFIATGLVALVFGTVMTVAWPLPGPYNSAFGEMSVLFGVIFGLAGISMALGWSLTPMALYALFAGIGAVVIGVRIIDLKLTMKPALSGAGFIITGLGGVFATPALLWLRENKAARTLGALVMLAAAAIWAMTGYLGVWGHMETFQNWAPSTTR
jgi:putative membrane protein